MGFGFGNFDSGFSDFDIDVEDFKVKRTKKFDRIWKWSEGGSITFHVLDKNIAYFSSLDGYLYAVDVIKGKTIWHFKTDDSIFGTPSAVIDGMIAVGNFSGSLYLIDTETGKEIWKFKTGGSISIGPTMTRDHIYVGSKDGYFYSIKLDGTLEWRFKTSDEVAYGAVTYKDKILFGGFDGYLYCLSKEGEEIWRFRTGGEVIHDRPCLVHDGKVYFGSMDNYLYSLDIETGKEEWRFKTGKYGITGPPFLNNETLYVPIREGIVIAIDLEGKEMWRFKTSGLVISVVVHGDKIYFTSEDGNLYVLSKEGKELWRFKFGEGGSYDFPSIYGNMILVGSMDCHFYAIDMNTKEVLWRIRTSSQTRSTAPPPHDEFKMEIKRDTQIEDAVSEDKYKSKKEESISLSDYHVENEYASTSDYKTKSDYDVSMVIFEGSGLAEELPCLENEEVLTWISDLEGLSRDLTISMWK